MTGATSRQWWSQLPPYLKLNVSVAAAFLIAYLMSQLGFNWLLMPVGVVAFFLPGINLTSALERLSGQRQKPLLTVVWASLISLIITPAGAWAASLALGGDPLSFALAAGLAWWAGTLIITYVFHRYSKALAPLPAWPVWSELRQLGGLFLAVLLGALIIYPFIPEADSYTYMMRLREAELNPSLLAADGRALFLVLISLVSNFSQIEPYWLLKLGLPLLGLLLVIPLYLAAQDLVKQRSLRLLIALSPLYFPIIFQELLISRPQSIFLLTLIPALYLYGRLSLDRERPGNIYWLLTLFVIGLIGLKIHTLFALILLLGAIAAFVFYGPKIARRPLDSLFVTAAAVIAIYPWIKDTGLIEDLTGLVRLFGQSFKDNPFTWWFLDNYRNVDGNLAGWPGWAALFYYGYNIGLFLPGLLVLWLTGRNRSGSSPSNAHLWPVWVTLVIFLVIAEVAPRFNLAFLPDRAWLLIAVAMSLLIPTLVARLPMTTKSSRYRQLLAGLAALAILSSWGISYAKEGWIASPDYPAAAFIRQSTPANSVFLTQGGNHVLVRYFAERQMIRPLTDIFTPDDPEAVEKYLDHQIVERQVALDANLERRRVLRKELERLEAERLRLPESSQVILDAQQMLLNEQYKAAIDAHRSITSAYPTIESPVYILYSKNKFRSFYSQRSWWRNSNFYGANLEKYSSRYPLIYDRQGVMIWKVKD